MSSNEIAILVSLFSLGFFGGFSHCIGMCGPLVLGQVNQRLENIKIENLTYLKRLSGISLLPYHLGRISTYSIIGICLSLLTYHLKEITGFRLFSAILLIFAGLIFIISGIPKIKLPFKINFITNHAFTFFEKISRFFLMKPFAFRGYLLGVILGFLPCGLLYAAFSLAASLDNYLLAGCGMLVFGLATIPSLFLTAFSGQLIFSKFSLKLLAKIILLINGVSLIIMAWGLILNRV